MKTLFAALLIALTVSTSSTSFASAAKAADNGQKEQGGSVTFAIQKSKVDVVVQPAENVKTVIRLTDSSGNTIATKNLLKAESGTRVRFDMSQLADGLYAVRVWDGKNSQVKRIELKTASPTIANQELTFL